MYEEKIIELGLKLPPPPKPLATYIPSVAIDKTVFTAGQIPVIDGTLMFKGKVGKDLDLENAKEAAGVCVLNCLGVIKAIIGNLDNIERILKLTVFVNSADGFTDQALVANGASELLIRIFGENGKHVRSAVGVNELPINAAVEVEMMARLR